MVPLLKPYCSLDLVNAHTYLKLLTALGYLNIKPPQSSPFTCKTKNLASQIMFNV